MAATDLNGIIIKALRLSSAAGTALSDEIDRQIRTARSELIRVGVTSALANSDQDLIDNAIVTFALMNMGANDTYERYKESWLYQIDCIRKSTITVPEPEVTGDAE